MIVPSAVNMRMRFPEFADVDAATLEFAIEEATRGVDDTWFERDQTLAIMYLAAHYLMVNIQRAESATGQVTRSETIGRMSITYDTSGVVNADAADLSTTQYGSRYLDMLRGNKPPIMVI
jgi:hypothetical protein